ncbi:MAG: energy transducer TonB [Gammaproteobacteria bacterium]|nr:energy transducer TonB [Gammaproteobacteria bacterium]
MAYQAVFDAKNTLANNDRLLGALFIAAIVHLMIILGIRFTEPKPPVYNSRSIDIVLVDTPAKKAPKKAQYLAQDNQIGAGEVSSNKPQPEAKRIINQGDSKRKQQAHIEQAEETPRAKQKLVTQRKAPVKVVAEKHSETTHDQVKRPHLTAEMLEQQIAQYGTEIRRKQESSDQSKIKSLNSVSAHKYVAAQYIKDWERKVERTGNMNYPSIAAKKGFSGSLTMDVGIKPDGSIYSMRIVRSSGYPALDEAAKRIVKMSAPFPALPSDLLKELNVLVITRKWKFSDESGMTTP